MKRLFLAVAMLLGFVTMAQASATTDRVIVRIRDAQGQPVPGAHVVAIEGAAEFMRQTIISPDSNGIAVAEVDQKAFVGLRVTAPGYKPWRLDMEPGVVERKGAIIHVTLAPRKGERIPVSL